MSYVALTGQLLPLCGGHHILPIGLMTARAGLEGVGGKPLSFRSLDELNVRVVAGE